MILQKKLFNGTSPKMISVTTLIFSHFQFQVSENIKVNGFFVDLQAKKDDKEYYVEIKAPQSERYYSLKSITLAAEETVEIAKRNGTIPVLFVYSRLSSNIIKALHEKHAELIVYDIKNILYIIQDTSIRDDVVAVLPFSVKTIPTQNITYEKWKILVPEHTDTPHKSELKEEELFIKLESTPKGKGGATAFEEICFELLKKIFSDDLALWDPQKKSNKDLYRFDLLCRIKDEPDSKKKQTFWRIMEQYFNSKYIIFEYKNYAGKITQREIYTTERYLYQKALRNVAIIIARSGYDGNSEWAAKGCLRENGKLILLLKIEDVKMMYKMKQDGNDPSTILLNKLDELLANLEK